MEIKFQPPGNGGRRDGGQENLCFFAIFCVFLCVFCVVFCFFVFFFVVFCFFYVCSMFFGVFFDVLSDPQTVDHQIQGREKKLRKLQFFIKHIKT